LALRTFSSLRSTTINSPQLHGIRRSGRAGRAGRVSTGDSRTAPPTDPSSCQRDSRTGQYNRCENARNDKHADQARLDADRARKDRDRAKLDRDRANGDWQRANRDRDRLSRDRGNIQGDKNNINRDGRRECNNLNPRPKYVYVGGLCAVRMSANSL
jgi:hypothetical protein